MKSLRVPIAGIPFSVKWVEHLSGGDWAEFDCESREIILSERHSSKVSALESLLHEMAHGALWSGGLSYVLDNNLEEAVVRNIEQIYLPAVLKLLGVDLTEVADTVF